MKICEPAQRVPKSPCPLSSLIAPPGRRSTRTRTRARSVARNTGDRRRLWHRDPHAFGLVLRGGCAAEAAGQDFVYLLRALAIGVLEQQALPPSRADLDRPFRG